VTSLAKETFFTPCGVIALVIEEFSLSALLSYEAVLRENLHLGGFPRPELGLVEDKAVLHLVWYELTE
jgi:hypothetical protein